MMERDSADSDWSIVTEHASRRRALAAVGTVVGGGTTLALVGSDGARAGVSVESFEVADATFEASEVTPVLDATIGYAYRADHVAELWIGLLVGEEVVAEETLRTASEELENSTDLSGRVTDSPAYAAADFAVGRGEETSVTVEAGVRFEVRDADGDVLAGDEATDEATVEVVSPESGSYATIGGLGEVRDAE